MSARIDLVLEAPYNVDFKINYNLYYNYYRLSTLSYMKHEK